MENSTPIITWFVNREDYRKQYSQNHMVCRCILEEMLPSGKEQNQQNHGMMGLRRPPYGFKMPGRLKPIRPRGRPRKRRERCEGKCCERISGISVVYPRILANVTEISKVIRGVGGCMWAQKVKPARLASS